MEQTLRHTRSLCPVCLKNLPARLTEREDGQVELRKCCPEHGEFSVPVWRGKADFSRWVSRALPLEAGEGERCPRDCGICAAHASDSCCVLLEVTKRCNLRCSFCFASAGSPEEDPCREDVEEAIRDIVRQRGSPLLQLSGGEPTLRDDLPALVRFAREAGCSYVQVNTNGLRLAAEPDYARALAEAGLDIVFLQFDGVEEEVYLRLRGKALLREKEAAIRVCSELGLGVTLVPTVVPGVNEKQLGALVRYAAEHAPGVRGIHFQPVSYFGRYPEAPESDGRYTLDQLMADLSEQAGIPLESFLPSRCDHPLCGFHARYLIRPEGGLMPLSDGGAAPTGRSSARENRNYVARHWRHSGTEAPPPGKFSDEMDFDTFLYRIRNASLTLSAMVFQDAMNLNVERLRSCSLHVYNGGKVLPFCANYLSPMGEEEAAAIREG